MTKKQEINSKKITKTKLKIELIEENRLKSIKTNPSTLIEKEDNTLVKRKRNRSDGNKSNEINQNKSDANTTTENQSRGRGRKPKPVNDSSNINLSLVEKKSISKKVKEVNVKSSKMIKEKIKVSKNAQLVKPTIKFLDSDIEKHLVHESLRQFQTQNQETAHNASTYVISCMDFRLLDDIVRAMDAMGYNNNYDQFIVAGSSLGFVQDKFPHWGETVMDHMNIGLSLHNFRSIIIIDHEDCGAFKKFMPYKNKEEEYNNHKDCLQKAYERLSKHFPDFSFHGFLMDLKGNMTQIEIKKNPVQCKIISDESKNKFLSEFSH